MKIGDIILYEGRFVGIMLDPNSKTYTGKPGYLCQFWLEKEKCWEPPHTFTRDRAITLVGNLDTLGIKFPADFRMWSGR